jgi:hypothetical protein
VDYTDLGLISTAGYVNRFDDPLLFCFSFSLMETLYEGLSYLLYVSSGSFDTIA